ncbi:methyltransferase [Brachyspira suanatina]|uniref:Methyltransferase n=1 Tax=Brachyspira suanatina TaxID=381802 RepID=A0A0G4KAZ5_9SPIR|nr:FkbM family methyltransferase [Brachyspira suanatina]CRF35249.1 methyltransferase [Brachyspira suanatina]
MYHIPNSEEVEKIINKIVWWIPFKNCRNLIRAILLKIYNIDDNIIRLENVIIYNNSIAMSKLILDKLGIKKEYYNILLDINENDICIDCGANMGLFTRLVDVQKGICYSFEPNTSLYNHLSKRYKDSKYIHIYNNAVSNKNEKVKFFTSGDNYVNDQAFTMSYEMTDNYIEVDSIKFSDFIKNDILTKHDFIYLIKIDIEGEEFNVLEDLINENIYKKVGYIFVETHERFFENGEERLNKIKKLIEYNNIKNIYLDWI